MGSVSIDPDEPFVVSDLDYSDRPTKTNGRSFALQCLRADIDRYREDAWLLPLWFLTERTIWAVVVFRLGQRALEIRSKPVRNAAAFAMSLLSTASQVLTGIEMAPTTVIGPGLRIYHGTGLVINAGAVIGARVVLRQGVTVGAVDVGGANFPVIGDNVHFGAYAQVFGSVMIGNDVRIGAMSVVLSNVPEGATAVGAPARVVDKPKPAPRS